MYTSHCLIHATLPRSCLHHTTRVNNEFEYSIEQQKPIVLGSSLDFKLLVSRCSTLRNGKVRIAIAYSVLE